MVVGENAVLGGGLGDGARPVGPLPPRPAKPRQNLRVPVPPMPFGSRVTQRVDVVVRMLPASGACAARSVGTEGHPSARRAPGSCAVAKTRRRPLLARFVISRIWTRAAPLRLRRSRSARLLTSAGHRPDCGVCAPSLYAQKVCGHQRQPPSPNLSRRPRQARPVLAGPQFRSSALTDRLAA